MRIEDVLKGHGVGGSGKYQEISTLHLIKKSNPFVNSISSLASDGTHIYAKAGTTIFKINPSDMSIIAESVDTSAYNVVIYKDGYIYTGKYVGYSNYRVAKIDTADMSIVAESSNLPRAIDKLVTDGTYIYCSINTDNRIYKIDPEDMGVLPQTYSIGMTNYTLLSAGEFLYCHGSVNNTLAKVDTDSMSKVAQSSTFPGSPYALAFDGEYVYLGTNAGTNSAAYKLLPSTLDIVKGVVLGDSISHMVYAEKFIYASVYRSMVQINPVDMLKRLELFGDGSIRHYAYDGKFIYAHETPYKILQITNKAYIKK